MRFKQFYLEAKKPQPESTHPTTVSRTYKVWVDGDRVNHRVDDWLRAKEVEVELPSSATDAQWHNRAVQRYLTSQADKHGVKVSDRDAFYARNTRACRSRRVEHTATPLDRLMARNVNKQAPNS